MKKGSAQNYQLIRQSKDAQIRLPVDEQKKVERFENDRNLCNSTINKESKERKEK